MVTGTGIINLSGGFEGAVDDTANGKLSISLEGTVYRHDEATSDKFVITVPDDYHEFNNALQGFKPGIDKIDLSQIGIPDVSYLWLVPFEYATADNIAVSHGVQVTITLWDGTVTSLVYLDSIDPTQLRASDFIFSNGLPGDPNTFIATSTPVTPEKYVPQDTDGSENPFLVGSNAGITFTQDSNGHTIAHSSVDYVLSNDINTLELTGENKVIGTANNNGDTLIGNNAQSTLIGGSGNDTYVIQNSSTTIIESSTGGTDTAQASVSYTLGANVEKLTLTGAADINGTGNNANNLITGNSGANSLDGGGGKDTLNGGDGNDTYVYSETTLGQSTIIDSSGNDTIDLSALSANLNVNLSSGSTVTNHQKALLNLNNSPDGSKLLTDVFGNIWSASGSAAVQSSNPWKTGEKEIALTTSSDSIRTTSFVPSGSSYTLHWRERFDTVGNTKVLMQSVAGFSIALTMENGKLGFYLSTNGTTWNIANSQTTYGIKTNWAANQWYDFEITYSSTSGYKVYVNGVQDVSLSSTAAAYNPGGIVLGSGYAGANNCPGAISDVYFTNGEVLNTSNFTPSSGSYYSQLQPEITWDSNAIENVIGGSGNDTLTGTSGDNVLTGGVGNDSLVGGLGNDTYVFAPGFGVDTINDAGGNDTLDLNAYTTGVNVNLSATSFVDGANSISWGTNAIENLTTGSGNDTLTGSAGNNVLSGGTGNDRYVFANGFGADSVNDGAGTDTFDFSSVTSGIVYDATAGTAIAGSNSVAFNAAKTHIQSILGGSGNDQFTGNASSETFAGGSGNDTYIASKGADTITDASGTDQASFVGSDTTDATWTAVDSNSDGKLDQLKVDFGSGKSVTINNYFDNSSTNVLSSNAGTGVIESLVFDDDSNVTFADVQTMLSSAGVYLPGTSGNDTLTGGTGRDTLDGLAGNDSLNGGAGADSMLGGLGDDIYVVDDSGDQVIENTGEGTDTVQASLNYILDANLENLTLTGSFDLNGTGNELNNVLTGNSGSNILDGGTGADTLIGGTGNDTYIVDNSGDVVTESASAGTDTIQTSVSYTLSANVENLILSGSSSINGTGNDLANTLTGNSGANVLDGGIGADTLIGGTGNDTYIVDNSGDVVTEAASAGTDTIQASVSYTLSANVENLTLTGYSALNGTGNELNNSIVGNDGINVLSGGNGNDTLSAAGGNDTLDGGAGNDSLAGDTGNDTYQGFSVTSGADVITDASGTDTANFGTLNSTDVMWGALDSNGDGFLDQLKIDFGSGNSVTINNYFNNDAATLANSTAGSGVIETLAFANGNLAFSDVKSLMNTSTGGGQGQYLEGTDQTDDTLTGGSGNDTLIGHDGQDVLNGGAGNDLLEGMNGWDRYVFNNNWGQDTIDAEWSGGDWLDFTSVTSNLTINLVPGTGNEVTDGTNTVNWTSGNVFEYILGGSGNDSITGDITDDFLLGNDGNDTLIGAAGDDYLEGGSGNDSLSGGAGDDHYASLSNSTGADVLTDLSGTDRASFDVVSTAGTWSAVDSNADGYLDQLVIDYGSGNSVTINNYFDNSASTVANSNAGAGLIETLSFSNGDLAFADVKSALIASTPGQYLEGTDETDDTLTGGAGNDTLIGHDGQDVLNGGAGNDLLEGMNGWDRYVFDNNWGQDTIDAEWSGGDFLDFSSVTSNLTINLVAGAGNEVTDGTNTVNWDSGNVFEYIIGGSGNDLITGDVTDDVLTGNAGNDTLIGGDGDDYLEGNTGNDSLVGGANNDTYAFETNLGADTIADASGTDDSASFNGLSSTSAVWSAVDSNADGYLDQLKIDYGVGNSVTINNYFNNDATTVAGSTSGSGLIETLSFVNTDLTFSDVQDLLTTGSQGQYLEGDDQTDDTLIGGNGNDTLIGHDGQDVLNGGFGNDLLEGMNGWDRYAFNNNWGQDTIDAEWSGGDFLDMSAVSTDLTINLVTGSGDEVTDGTNTVNWDSDQVLEYIIGGSGNDSITGDVTDDDFTGNDGNDTLNGGQGNDYLQGNAGADVYKFALGDGQDIVNDNDSNGGSGDKILFDSSVTQSNIAIFKDASGELQIGYTDSSGDLITVQNFDSAEGHIEQLELSTGYYMTDANINQLIADMASYAETYGVDFNSLSDVENNANLMSIVNGGWHS